MGGNIIRLTGSGTSNGGFIRPILAKCSKSRFGERVFLCTSGKRHFVSDAARLAAYGFNFPLDVMEVPEPFLTNLKAAQFVPTMWSDADLARPPRAMTMRDVREMAACRIAGTGLELGALASPFPAPIHCNVVYGDLCSHQELVAQYPDEPLDDLVAPLIKTEFETLAGINDGSVDFILASHVIEHTRDPIGAITNAHSKLREGGSLVLVIPDMRRTFDRSRQMTTLSYLIEDFRQPDRERDKQHFQEFFHKVKDPLRSGASSVERWEDFWATRQPIHYHTWVYESFLQMINWIVEFAAPFEAVWTHGTLPGEENFEFYVTLRK